MRYRKLPRTDLDPSVVCLGTMYYGSRSSQDEAFRMLDCFLQQGGNFIDTAYAYADWACDTPGISERTLGAWLKSRDCRDRVILATKGGAAKIGVQEYYRPMLRPEEIRRQLSESLERLGVDRIDVYWLHRDEPRVPVGELLDVLHEEVQQGRIRYYGASNWTTPRLMHAAEHAAGIGAVGFVATQNMWSLAHPNPGVPPGPGQVFMDASHIAYQRSEDLAAVPYTAQADGFFSGKYGRGITDSGKAQRLAYLYYNAESFARLERAKEMAAAKDVSTNQIAVAYLINQDFPVYPIAGCRTPEQLEDSCAAAEIRLTPDEVAYLDSGTTD